MAGRPNDLTGQRFGMLTAVKYIPGTGHHDNRWLCRCDCGRTSNVLAANLAAGRTKSCGCLRGKRAAEPTPARQAARKDFADRQPAIRNIRGLCYNVYCPLRNNYRPTVWSCSHCRDCPDRKLTRESEKHEDHQAGARSRATEADSL